MAGRQTIRSNSLSMTKSRHDLWPELSWSAWHQTATTLHLWTQVVGKIRMALAPPVNHWWHVALYPSCRGLTTSAMPYRDGRMIQMDFDFREHRFILQAHDAAPEAFLLEPMTVADFYGRVMEKMGRLKMPVAINTLPSEIASPLPFEEDCLHSAYDPVYANRFWQTLLQTQRVFSEFRSRFIGKVSPVHFFWGGFDLALTRFSGRKAPEHGPVPYTPDFVVKEAYSHEVSSCGFWPGAPGLEEAFFYSYAYPTPAGFAEASIQPKEAFFHPELGEFLLPLEAVRRANNPDHYLLAFLQSTYEAAATLGNWDRSTLEVPFAVNTQ